MAELKTDYVDDELSSSMQGKRQFNIVDSEGNILYENVNIEDVSRYSTVGDDFGAEDINATNSAVNELNNDLTALESEVQNMGVKAIYKGKGTESVPSNQSKDISITLPNTINHNKAFVILNCSNYGEAGIYLKSLTNTTLVFTLTHTLNGYAHTVDYSWQVVEYK